MRVLGSRQSGYKNKKSVEIEQLEEWKACRDGKAGELEKRKEPDFST
jgi:hypothetical protein